MAELKREELTGEFLIAFDKIQELKKSDNKQQREIGLKSEQTLKKLLASKKGEAVKKEAPKKSKTKQKPKAKTTPKKSSTKTKTIPFTKRASILMKKEGITWEQAKSKLKSQIKEEKNKLTKEALDELQKLINAPEFQKAMGKYGKSVGGGKKTLNSDIVRDAKRPAKPRGKRISKNGKTYYEYRDNRSDVRQKGYPYLAEGGAIDSLKKQMDDKLEIHSEYYKKGGRTIKIVNDGVKFDKSKYKTIYEDFDKDGIVNIDDANPLDKSKNAKVEQVELRKTFDKLLSVKAELDDVMYDAVETLDDKAPKGADIYARTKTPYSILKKLVEKRMLDPKRGLTDMIGTTIAVENQKELEQVRDEIDGGLLGKVLDRDDFYKSPNAGYRAYHYIVEFKGVPVEVQLKTKNMKKLHEVGHDAYKTGSLDAKSLDSVSKTFMKADKGDKKAKAEIKKLLSDKKSLISKISKKMEAGGTLPTPFGQAGLVGETGTLNEMELFAMGGNLPQGVHQYYGQTYNPAYPTPHGYAKGGKLDEYYSKMTEKLGKEGAFERVLKDSQFGIPKGQTDYQHNRLNKSAIINDGKVFLYDNKPKGDGSLKYSNKKTFTSPKDLAEYLDENKIFAKGGNVPKVDEIYKRTYYWVADDKDGNILAMGDTKSEVMKQLKSMNKEGVIRMQKGGKVKRSFSGGVPKDYYGFFRGYRPKTTQYLLLGDDLGMLVTDYKNNDIGYSYDVYDEDYNFRGSADSLKQGEDKFQKIRLLKEDFKDIKSFKDLLIRKRIQFADAMTMKKGGKTKRSKHSLMQDRRRVSKESWEVAYQKRKKNKMAKGGEISSSELDKWDELLDNGADVVVYDKNGVKYVYQGSSFEKDGVAVMKGFDESTYRIMPINDVKSIEIGNIYAKGGEVDLFEDYENLPENLSVIVNKYAEMDEMGEMDYSDTAKFLKEVQSLGYTFDYGLDNQPFNLRKMAKGGEVNEVYVDFMNKDKGFKVERKYFKTYQDAEKWARSEFERFNPDMIGYTEYERPLTVFSKGGKTKRSKHSLMQDRRRVSKQSWEVAYQKRKKNKMEAGGTLPTPFGQAGLVGETGTLNEMELFAMGGGLPQGVHQYYANTYNPAYPTPHGYAKGGKINTSKKGVYLMELKDGTFKVSNNLGDRDFPYEFNDVFPTKERAMKFANRVAKNSKSKVVEIKYAKGGKTQGYNDKLDESLGNTKGKRSTKEQNYKDRRNESEAMEKKGGKRKYARVKTMDKGNRKKKMKTPMTLAKAIRREGEKWQDAVKRASAMIRKDS